MSESKGKDSAATEESQEEATIRYAEKLPTLLLHKRSYSAECAVPVPPKISINLGLMFTRDFEKNNTWTSPAFGDPTLATWTLEVNPHHYEFVPAEGIVKRYISIMIRREINANGVEPLNEPVDAACTIQILDEQGQKLCERGTGVRAYIPGERYGWARFALFDDSKHSNRLKLNLKLDTHEYFDHDEPKMDEKEKDLLDSVTIIHNGDAFTLTKREANERIPNLEQLSEECPKFITKVADGKFRIKFRKDLKLGDSNIRIIEFLKTGDCDLSSCYDDAEFMIACQSLVILGCEYKIEQLKTHGLKRMIENANIHNIVNTIICAMTMQREWNVKLTKDEEQLLMKCLVDNHNELIENHQFENLQDADMKDIIRFMFVK